MQNTDNLIDIFVHSIKLRAASLSKTSHNLALAALFYVCWKKKKEFLVSGGMNFFIQTRSPPQPAFLRGKIKKRNRKRTGTNQMKKFMTAELV